MARSAPHRLLRLLPAAGVMGCAAMAQAQVFDNGDPSGGFGTAVLSERDSINQVADDFNLTGSETIGQVQWWGTGDGNDFSLRIFDSTGGAPNADPLHTIDLGTIVGNPVSSGGGNGVFEYNASFAPINLSAGGYQISIVETNPQTNVGDGWFWSASCEDGCEGESWRREAEGEAWATGNWQFAFVLDVPEPGTGAIALIGGAALLRRRRF